MKPASLLLRFLFVLPFLLAVGTWAGHQTIHTDHLEHHPSYPLEILSFLAPVPECPPAMTVRFTPPVVRLPRTETPALLPAAPTLPPRPARGPPASCAA